MARHLKYKSIDRCTYRLEGMQLGVSVRTRRCADERAAGRVSNLDIIIDL